MILYVVTAGGERVATFLDKQVAQWFVEHYPSEEQLQLEIQGLHA